MEYRAPPARAECLFARAALGARSFPSRARLSCRCVRPERYMQAIYQRRFRLRRSCAFLRGSRARRAVPSATVRAAARIRSIGARTGRPGRRYPRGSASLRALRIDRRFVLRLELASARRVHDDRRDPARRRVDARRSERSRPANPATCACHEIAGTVNVMIRFSTRIPMFARTSSMPGFPSLNPIAKSAPKSPKIAPLAPTVGVIGALK